MIELQKNKKSYELLIDGHSIERSHVFGFERDKKERIFVHLYETKDSEEVAAHDFAELPQMERLELTYDFDWLPHPCTVRVEAAEDSNSMDISFKHEFEYEDWKGPYSFAEYYSGFEEQLNSEHSDVTARQDDDEALANGFWITFTVPPMQGPLADQILACARTLAEITESVGASLRMQIADDSVALQFEFPDEVRVSCEQYLLYFAQFLKDLGVGADTAITSEAGHVLFTVTPTDEKEALDRIRDALDLYLRLPTSPITPADHESAAVQRLEANILRLRADLRLAAAELQTKNATIEAQQLTIQIQKRWLSGEILMDSVKNVTPKPEDKEPLLGGVVALATLKAKGLEVNLGELFRKLKKKFSKE